MTFVTPPPAPFDRDFVCRQCAAGWNIVDGKVIGPDLHDRALAAEAPGDEWREAAARIAAGFFTGCTRDEDIETFARLAPALDPCAVSREWREWLLHIGQAIRAYIDYYESFHDEGAWVGGPGRRALEAAESIRRAMESSTE